MANTNKTVGGENVMDLLLREKLNYTNGDLSQNGITAVVGNGSSGLVKDVNDLKSKIDGGGTTDIDTLRMLIDDLIFCLWVWDKEDNYLALKNVKHGNIDMRIHLRDAYRTTHSSPGDTIPWNEI